MLSHHHVVLLDIHICEEAVEPGVNGLLMIDQPLPGSALNTCIYP